ncbi:hypothetical protein GCM10010349_06790 [Streptomyces flavofungini]|nr:hypothetical protein GCM10010349_06790 [Streptomyces flavofungini]
MAACPTRGGHPPIPACPTRRGHPPIPARPAFEDEPRSGDEAGAVPPARDPHPPRGPGGSAPGFGKGWDWGVPRGPPPRTPPQENREELQPRLR